MNAQLDEIRDLPRYLAPVDLAERARSILDELRYLHKRLRKARKKARKNPNDMSLVWSIESEIRDCFARHQDKGLRCLTREEFAQHFHAHDQSEETLDQRVSIWDDLSIGNVISHFRTLALQQASAPVPNPYMDDEYRALLQQLSSGRPRWKKVKAALAFVGREQRHHLHELHLMFANIADEKAPTELDQWVDAIEAVTELKDDPYESLREGVHWLTDGLGLVGFWAQKHLWQRTRRQERTRTFSLISVEFLSAATIIALALVTDLKNPVGAVAGGIAMPFMGFLPYIAYVSFRIREVAGGLPGDFKRVTWQYRFFYAMTWVMMLGPFLVHRWLPRKLKGVAGVWWRERRLRKALEVYVDALLEGDKRGHILAEMLKVRHQLATLRRRFEVVPLTVLSEFSHENRYVVLDLPLSVERGCTLWLRDDTPS